jgi:hypothetical protein
VINLGEYLDNQFSLLLWQTKMRSKRLSLWGFGLGILKCWYFFLLASVFCWSAYQAIELSPCHQMSYRAISIGDPLGGSWGQPIRNQTWSWKSGFRWGMGSWLLQEQLMATRTFPSLRKYLIAGLNAIFFIHLHPVGGFQKKPCRCKLYSLILVGTRLELSRD